MVVIIFSSCDKGDKFIKNELTGRVFFNDLILKPGILIPAKGIDVFYSPDSLARNYLIRTKTDSNGYFKFSHLRENEDYIIASGTYESKLFEGNLRKTDLKSGSTNIIIAPVINYGLKVIVHDSLQTPLNNARVCLYTSKTLFATDSCELGIRNVITNENGIAFFNDLVPMNTPYYILAKSKIDTIQMKAKGESIISQGNRNAVSITLVVK